MLGSIGAGISLAEITKAQQSDRFASQMSAFLTKEVLPSDEIEVLRTIANAPFYAVDDGALVRVTKGKALKPLTDGPDISSVDRVQDSAALHRERLSIHDVRITPQSDDCGQRHQQDCD